MNDYPAAVAKIVDDYLQRVKAQLRLVPASEQQEFVLEIQSHVYDAYREAQEEDEVGRILGVLRRLGEPAEVVADRLPGAMVRSGRTRSAPAFILAGILIALFGVPLGFGGAAVVAGVLLALVGVVAGFYATAFAFLLSAALLLVGGLTRMSEPELWNRLVAAGVIQMDPEMAGVLDQLPVNVQGFAMILGACIFTLVGMGMLWVGKRMMRGVGFLFTLVLDKARQLGRRVRRRVERRLQVPFNTIVPADEQR